MPRQLLTLLLPALLLAACGQTPAAVPSKTVPGATTPGTPAQQALPGVFQIDFDRVGTDTPISRIQSMHSGGLSAQGLISAPDQFTFSQVAVQTFAVAATGIRHVRVTYEVKNTSSQTLRNPKFVAVVPQGSTTESVFTNVRYFDGSDASTAIGNLSLVQGQTFNVPTKSAIPDAQATALLTGLDVSAVDTTGKGIKTLTQTGWWITTPPAPGNVSFLAPGETALITFGVNVPMTPAANGGATKDPFSFSLNVTAVQETQPLVALSSAVKQWDKASKTFGNYVNFPTQTYAQNGSTLTRSLPAYYDIKTLDNTTTPKVLCGGDANMTVTKLNTDTANFPNRWRVQLRSLGQHTLNVFEGTSCPTSGTPLLSQTVTGVGTNVSSLSAGNVHNLALLADRTIQGWGSNRYGQLGDSSGGTLGPVNSLSGITSVAGGGFHSLALKVDGTVWAWGHNSCGQLGDGTTNDRSTPGSVSNLSDMVGIAAGSCHNVALKADGTVWSWGSNSNGQLGDGTTTTRTTPVMVSGLSGIASIAMGNAHSLALRADGTVQSWGYNRSGQLGDGTTTDRTTPVTVRGLSGVMSLSAGEGHSLALQVDGTVQNWGSNESGQLGDGTTTDRTTPVTVSGLSGITSIAAGRVHSLALKGDGTVWSWGSNYVGQLGDGTMTTRTTPVMVGGLSGITRVVAGSGDSLALKADGTVWNWGENNAGQMGDGTTTNRTTPVAVSGLSGVAP